MAIANFLDLDGEENTINFSPLSDLSLTVLMIGLKGY